jgi:hypothetical protein
MTNKCDLEELRHAALQQIFESATTTPEEWKAHKNEGYSYEDTWFHGKFMIRHYMTYGYTANEAFFGGEPVGTATYFWGAVSLSDDAVEAAYKAYSDHPATKAYNAIQQYQTDRQRAAACQRLAKAMSIEVDPPEEKLALEAPYSISNGYDPEPNALTTWIKNWWAKRRGPA